MQPLRAISRSGLLLTGIGSIIGSGWLFGPLYAAQLAGPASILSWVLGGVMMIIISLTFAELGAAFPLNGGMVRYAEFSHGPLLAFIIGWMVWISSVAVAPVETYGLLQYSSNYFPSLIVKHSNTKSLSLLGVFFGASIMLSICILNSMSAKIFSQSSSLITILKLLVPISTFTLLITTNFHPANFVHSGNGGFIPYGWHSILSVLPLGGIIYSFIGANTVLQLAGETKNPQFSIPLALIGSIVLCILLYGMLQTAFIGALDNSTIIKGFANIHYDGDSGPFAGLLTAAGFGTYAIFLYGDALISPFGTAYIFTGSTARVNYGLSKIGFFPLHQQKLNKVDVPINGLITNYIVGLLLFFPFPGWQELISFVISCFIFSYIIGPIALVVLRKKLPSHTRPFKIPFPTLLSSIAFYFCNLLIYWTGWHTVSRMIAILLVGIVIFAFRCMRARVPIWKQQCKSLWWLVPYLLSVMFISHCGSFGEGKGKIPFGWDFLIILVMSIVIFILALRVSSKAEILEFIPTGMLCEDSATSINSIKVRKNCNYKVTVPLLNRW